MASLAVALQPLMTFFSFFKFEHWQILIVIYENLNISILSHKRPTTSSRVETGLFFMVNSITDCTSTKLYLN